MIFMLCSALRLTDCLSLSFAWFVTLPYVRFSSGLLVKHYPGWIIQLICTSFAWRSDTKTFTQIEINFAFFTRINIL